MKSAHAAIQASLEASNFRSVKILVRFYCELLNANVILPSTLIALFDTLLSVKLELNVKQERSDAYIFCVMAGFPWVTHIY